MADAPWIILFFKKLIAAEAASRFLLQLRTYRKVLPFTTSRIQIAMQFTVSLHRLSVMERNKSQM
jgi:hypothetical protein